MPSACLGVAQSPARAPGKHATRHILALKPPVPRTLARKQKGDHFRSNVLHSRLNKNFYQLDQYGFGGDSLLLCIT